jgi:S-DNA-T family DNA segregation ATPase FtsK/SpoIIIE
VFDVEAAPARQDAVRRNATTEYLSLSRQRNDRVKRRGIAVGAGSLLLSGGVWAFVALAPLAYQLTLAAVVVALLGRLGVPGDRRVTDPGASRSSPSSR